MRNVGHAQLIGSDSAHDWQGFLYTVGDTVLVNIGSAGDEAVSVCEVVAIIPRKPRWKNDYTGVPYDVNWSVDVKVLESANHRLVGTTRRIVRPQLITRLPIR